MQRLLKRRHVCMVTDEVKRFLQNNTHADLAALYDFNMELQVQVTQDGEPTGGKTKSGHSWKGWTDGKETWKHIRIPWNSGDYQDRRLNFSTSRFRAVGMSGWDWKNKRSAWVGYDFDSVVGHHQGLTEHELDEIKHTVSDIDWVTVRTSTSGKGLHLYVFLAESPVVNDRQEHIALARAILGLITARIGIPLHTKVDANGVILWVWHSEKTGGLELIKQGTELHHIPSNWRDHTAVIKRDRLRVSTPGNEHNINELVIKTKFFPLSDRHLSVLTWFSNNNCLSWWDPDRNMFVCHTYDLKRCHTELKLKGPFDTEAKGTDKGNDQNAFMHPLPSGWVVRRHGKNTKEHVGWNTDSSGWTKTYYDRPADLGTACRYAEGSETKTGSFIFRSLDDASIALSYLDISLEDEPLALMGRMATVAKEVDGTVIISVPRTGSDSWYQGWAPSKGTWEKIIHTIEPESDLETPDELVRHVVCNHTELGWFLHARGKWVRENRQNVLLVLRAMGMDAKSSSNVLGNCIINHWDQVCKPFEDEYPGDREWNRNAPQLSCIPTPGAHPHWDMVMNHVGTSLDETIQENKWARRTGLERGGDYLKLWLASLIRKPFQPSPYLFMYGPQDSGKSMFHEAARLLFKNGIGHVHAESAVEDKFNGQLRNAVLCIIEEIELGKNKRAYNKIKDWVTGKTIALHEKGYTVYDIPNTTHWVQCSNEIGSCPIFPGDTRITFFHVKKPERIIPKPLLEKHLEKEVSHFLYTLTNLELPPPVSRLAIPVLQTFDKQEQEEARFNAVTLYFQAKTYEAAGHVIQLSESYQNFLDYLAPDQRIYWPKSRYVRELPDWIVRGRYAAGGQIHIANRTYNPDIKPGPYPLVRRRGKLIFSYLAEEAELDRIVEGA